MMEHESETYTYSKRALGKNEIRVIEIAAGSGNDIIRCELLTVQRKSAESFKALSYAWEDVTPTDFILVDGKKFWLHKNLFEALHAIRKETEKVRLWTDRICINQDNIPEKNSQVEHMGRTYSSAEEVLIWLGHPARPESDLEYLVHVVNHHSILTDEEWVERFPSFMDVLSREWFKRLWIMQEAALARKATLLFGSQQCDLSIALQFVRIDWFAVEFVTQLFFIDSTPDILDLALANLRNLSIFRDIVSSKSFFTIGRLMYYCRRQQCSDPRDRVFGITGIADHLDIKHMKVDYNLSLKDTFLRARLYALLSDPQELVLSDIEPSQLGLPSWAPDLTQPPDASMFHLGLYRTGGTDERFKLNVESFSHNFKWLTLRGYTFATVNATYKAKEADCWTDEDFVRVELHLVAKSGDSPYGDYNARLAAFWRTLVANRYDAGSADASQPPTDWPCDDNGAVYEVYCDRAAPLTKAKTPSERNQARWAFAKDFIYNSSTASNYRNLFITHSKHFGMGPKRTDAGDQIVVVPGLRLPIVIRPRLYGTHEFLGPAYVHGIMKGEFIETLRESGRLGHLQTFILD